MKYSLKIMALMALMPVAVLAQSLDSEVNAELDRMYSDSATAQAQAPQAGTNVQVNVQAQPLAAASTQTTQAQQVETQTVQAVPQAQAVGLQVVKQPTTVIEAAPLTESRAEQIRKARQEAELLTEQSIVEKLEQSRMEDEKRRAEVLFGDKFNSLNNANQAPAQAAPVAQPAPLVPVVVAPEAVVAPVAEQKVEEKAEEKIDRETIRGEVSAALAEMNAKQDAEKKKDTKKTYVGALLGAGDYPDAINVRGQYSAGVAIGSKFNDRLVVEGSFIYSNFQVEQPEAVMDPYGNVYPRITDMNQYNTSALIKYQLLGGMLRPAIGGVASYTYRTFTDSQFALSSDTASSHALDMGVMTGADIELSDSFSIGIDFRYMWNMTNKVDSGFQQSFVQPALSMTTPIEDLSYYTLSIVGRASF